MSELNCFYPEDIIVEIDSDELSKKIDNIDISSCDEAEEIIIEIDFEELSKKINDILISFEVERVEVELNEQQVTMFRGPRGNQYIPEDTLDIITHIDGDKGIIKSELTPLQYNSRFDFPNVGSINKLYVDLSDNSVYIWNDKDLVYKSIVEDWRDIELISGGEV